MGFTSHLVCYTSSISLNKSSVLRVVLLLLQTYKMAVFPLLLSALLLPFGSNRTFSDAVCEVVFCPLPQLALSSTAISLIVLRHVLTGFQHTTDTLAGRVVRGFVRQRFLPVASYVRCSRVR